MSGGHSERGETGRRRRTGLTAVFALRAGVALLADTLARDGVAGGVGLLPLDPTTQGALVGTHRAELAPGTALLALLAHPPDTQALATDRVALVVVQAVAFLGAVLAEAALLAGLLTGRTLDVRRIRRGDRATYGEAGGTETAGVVRVTGSSVLAVALEFTVAADFTLKEKK